ncbi:MAG: hypothetical protein JXQ29_18640 [Planctomycetes bacterium]|nr:hypothetical protein [Planctomycetota bacterium]
MTTKARAILEHLHATLAAVDGVVAVYGQDKPYQAPQQSKPEERPYVNLGMPVESESERANLRVLKELRVPVELVVTYNAADPAGSREAMQDLLGLVEVAIQADHTRGGYAIDTNVVAASQPSMVESAQTGRPACLTAEMTVVIDFGHLRTDPSAG